MCRILVYRSNGLTVPAGDKEGHTGSTELPASPGMFNWPPPLAGDRDGEAEGAEF